MSDEVLAWLTVSIVTPYYLTVTLQRNWNLPLITEQG